MRICLLALLVACKAETPCCETGEPEETCGPRLRTADWDEAALPKDPSASVDDTLSSLRIEGSDEGGPGVALSAVQAGYYHIRVQRDAGCIVEDSDPCMPFGYLYDPLEDRWEDDESIHRQVVATLAQARLYGLVQRPELLVSAREALQLLAGRVSHRDDGSARLYDIGATGLMVMALSEYQRVSGDRQWEETLLALGQTVLQAVEEDGSFGEGSALVWAQLHQALWRLHEATDDPVYRETFDRVARYAADHRDQAGLEEYFEYPYIYGLWANEPLTERYLEEPEAWLAELVFSIGDDVLGRQYAEGPPGVQTDTCDWWGGYTPTDGEGAPNWNSTIKHEAMVDAWRMADVVGDAERERLYRAAAESGTAWLMQNQYRKGDTDDFAQPEMAMGGFPLYDDDPDVRIDIPGHGSIAIAKSAFWLLEEDVPGEL